LGKGIVILRSGYHVTNVEQCEHDTGGSLQKMATCWTATEREGKFVT
jgi:hypothetical protein